MNITEKPQELPMEPKDPLILADRSRTHAVEILMLGTVQGSNRQVSDLFEAAMQRIAERAIRAGMVILTTSISTNSHRDDDSHYLTLTVICHWASREALEVQARQQALLPGSGPRRMP